MQRNIDAKNIEKNRESDRNWPRSQTDGHLKARACAPESNRIMHRSPPSLTSECTSSVNQDCEQADVTLTIRVSEPWHLCVPQAPHRSSAGRRSSDGARREGLGRKWDG
jgi:hypothetical protein